MSDEASIRQTYRREHARGRAWVLHPSGHLATRQQDVALVVNEQEPGSNPLITPHRLTFSVHGDRREVTISVDQLRALMDEIGPAKIGPGRG